MISMGIYRMRILQINILFFVLVSCAGCSIIFYEGVIPTLFSEKEGLVGRTFKTTRDLVVIRYWHCAGGVLRETWREEDGALWCRIPEGTVIKVGHVSRQHRMGFDVLIGYVYPFGGVCRKSFTIPYEEMVNGVYQMDPNVLEEVQP